jgi:hypothetical protein
VSHWEVIKLPLFLLGQAWIWTRVLSNLMSSVPLPCWFMCLTGFHCVSEAFTLTPWEEESPTRSSCPLVPGGISSWRSWGTHPGDKGGDNSPSPQSQIKRPQKCCRRLLRYGTLEANSTKQCFIVPAQTQWTHIQRLSSKNKSVSPYKPLQAGYRSKKQGVIHIWLYLILLTTLS